MNLDVTWRINKERARESEGLENNEEWADAEPRLASPMSGVSGQRTNIDTDRNKQPLGRC